MSCKIAIAAGNSKGRTTYLLGTIVIQSSSTGHRCHVVANVLTAQFAIRQEPFRFRPLSSRIGRLATPSRHDSVANSQAAFIHPNQSLDVRTRSQQVLPEKSDILRFQGPELLTNSGVEAAELTAF